jgi:hypothetical protein
MFIAKMEKNPEIKEQSYLRVTREVSENKLIGEQYSKILTFI